jgi:hypothetical protein
MHQRRRNIYLFPASSLRRPFSTVFMRTATKLAPLERLMLVVGSFGITMGLLYYHNTPFFVSFWLYMAEVAGYQSTAVAAY